MARARRMTMKGMNCVFLNGEMQIQSAMVVSGQVKEMALCHTGIKMHDEEVLMALKELSGDMVRDEELKIDLMRFEDYHKIAKTAECLLQPFGLRIGSLVCYRECPPDTDLAKVVASSRRLKLEDCKFSGVQWDRILKEMRTRIFNSQPICEEIAFHYWSWNPLKFSESSGRRLVKMFPKVKKISFYGNGFKFFPSPHQWKFFADEVARLNNSGLLRLKVLDTSEMYWGSYGGIPPNIQMEIENIKKCIGNDQI